MIDAIVEAMKKLDDSFDITGMQNLQIAAIAEVIADELRPHLTSSWAGMSVTLKYQNDDVNKAKTGIEAYTAIANDNTLIDTIARNAAPKCKEKTHLQIFAPGSEYDAEAGLNKSMVNRVSEAGPLYSPNTLRTPR